MKQSGFGVVVLAFVCSSAVAAQKTPSAAPVNKPMTSSFSADQAAASARQMDGARWLKKAAKAGAEEVAEATVAVDKAQRDDVKDFAQKMIDDHGKANQELASIAEAKNVTLPAETPPARRLESKAGGDFDKAYIAQELEEHKKAVKLFEKGTQLADPEIRAFAEKTLPTLREHLAQIEKLAGAPASAGSQ